MRVYDKYYWDLANAVMAAIDAGYGPDHPYPAGLCRAMERWADRQISDWDEEAWREFYTPDENEELY
jgi:hypothetical protein